MEYVLRTTNYSSLYAFTFRPNNFGGGEFGVLYKYYKTWSTNGVDSFSCSVVYKIFCFIDIYGIKVK